MTYDLKEYMKERKDYFFPKPILSGLTKINGEDYRVETGNNYNVPLFTESMKDEISPEELALIEAEHERQLQERER